MTKMTTCFSIILIAGFAMFKLIDIQIDEQTSLLDVAAHDKKMQGHAVNYYAFKDSFDATIMSLRSGEMKLAEALERVNSVAKRYNPEYFTHLAESGTSQDEHVVRNLVGHVGSLEEVHPSPISHLPQLEAELSELVLGFASKS